MIIALSSFAWGEKESQTPGGGGEVIARSKHFSIFEQKLESSLSCDLSSPSEFEFYLSDLSPAIPKAFTISTLKIYEKKHF